MGALTLPALDGQSITTTSPRVYPPPPKEKKQKNEQKENKVMAEVVAVLHLVLLLHGVVSLWRVWQ